MVKTKMYPSQMEPQGLLDFFVLFAWQSESCKVICVLCVYSLVHNSTGIAYLSVKSQTRIKKDTNMQERCNS